MCENAPRGAPGGGPDARRRCASSLAAVSRDVHMRPVTARDKRGNPAKRMIAMQRVSSGKGPAGVRPARALKRSNPLVRRRFQPQVDAAVLRVLIDFSKFFGREREVLQCTDVLLHLLGP